MGYNTNQFGEDVTPIDYSCRNATANNITTAHGVRVPMTESDKRAFEGSAWMADVERFYDLSR